jgi:hypothetical protein
LQESPCLAFHRWHGGLLSLYETSHKISNMISKTGSQRSSLPRNNGSFMMLILSPPTILTYIQSIEFDELSKYYA